MSDEMLSDRRIWMGAAEKRNESPLPHVTPWFTTIDRNDLS